jgi:CheY-like chemotaxis protein
VSEGALDPVQREFVDACRVAAEHHCRGIEDVRLVLGLVPEERQAIADFVPQDLFSGVAEIMGAMARPKQVGLQCKVASSVPPLVSADADRIGHALLRVADSVVSGLNGGEVHLNMRALASPDGFNLTFEIFVPGIVLSPILMRALQRDEFELDGLSDSEVLGMAAARKLATAFAGRLDASADTSAGTWIWITFPVAPPSGAVAHHQLCLPPSPDAQRALCILVAEDSDASFQLFEAYLRGQPHTVARASNGAEAVELAGTGTFDLLFMDISMPVMDGFAATRRIRELETGKDRPRLPIVVLSAEDLRAQRRKGALVGCSGHLSKPLRKNQLLEAIRTYSMLESPEPVSPMSTSGD